MVRTAAVLGYTRMTELPVRGIERELEARGFFTGATRYKKQSLKNVLKLYSEREAVPKTCVDCKETHTPEDDEDVCSIFRVADNDKELPQNLVALYEWEIFFAGLGPDEKETLKNGYDNQLFQCEICGTFEGKYPEVVEHEINCNG